MRYTGTNGTTYVVNYTYDNSGNIATISDGTDTIEYYYDKLNQLTRENNPYLDNGNGKTILYTYDNGGNLVTKKEMALKQEATRHRRR